MYSISVTVHNDIIEGRKFYIPKKEIFIFSTGSQGVSNFSATVSLDHWSQNGSDLSNAPGDVMNDGNARLNSTSQNGVPPVFFPSDEEGR